MMRCCSLILSISVKAEALTDKAERCGGGRDCAVSSKEQTCFSSSNKQQLPLPRFPEERKERDCEFQCDQCGVEVQGFLLSERPHIARF